MEGGGGSLRRLGEGVGCEVISSGKGAGKMRVQVSVEERGGEDRAGAEKHSKAEFG